MYKLRLKNFRCFKDTGEIRFAPITFLVGENSSGKTSFLAGYRYVHDFLRAGGPVSFNTPPFNMGAPEQILRRGAKDMSFETKWQKRKDRVSSRIKKTSNDSSKEISTKGAPSVGLDARLSAVDGELSVLSLDAAIPSGILSLTRRSAGKKGKALLNYSPQKKSGTNFSEMMIDEMSVRAMIFGLWENFRTHRIKHSNSKNNKIPNEGEKAKARQADKLGDELRGIMMSGRWGRLVPFAPMRSKPARVYEQEDIVQRSDEGDHIPRLLYDLHVRASKTQHAKFFQGQLTNFGKQTGLFSKIAIRRLGDKSFDPYQILVVWKKNAEADNLVDVGYGVSQALPIVSDILDMVSRDSPSFRRPVTFLIQQPEVHLHPRAQAALTTFFYQIHRETGARFLIETHSDHLVDRATIEIQEARKSKPKSERDTKPHEVFGMLYFEQNEARTESKIHQLRFDENGDIYGAPSSYREFFIEERIRHLGV